MLQMASVVIDKIHETLANRASFPATPNLVLGRFSDPVIIVPPRFWIDNLNHDFCC